MKKYSLVDKNCYYLFGSFETGFKSFIDLQILSSNLLERMIEESEYQHDKESYIKLDLNNHSDVLEILEMASVWTKPYKNKVFSY